MNLVLKIVEGPNKGAEIALVEGVTITLGKSDECDVVLADPMLPDEPMKIETSSDSVSVDGSVLESFHVLTAGATSFAVGPADSPWSELVWPKKEAPTEEVAEAAQEEATPAKAETPPPPAEQESEEKPKKRGVGCIVWLLIAFLLIAIAAVLCWLFWKDVRPYAEKIYAKCGGEVVVEQKNTVVTGRDAIPSIAEKYGLALTEKDGAPVISGNLKTRRERLAATAEAYDSLPGVELDISDDESFKAAADDAVFTLTEGAIRVFSATNRVLALSGASMSSASLLRTLKALNQDLPKLKGIDTSRVVVSPEAVAAVKSEDSDDAAPPSNVASASQAAPVAPKKNVLSFPVCGILTKPYPCLVMRDGSRVLEGASIGANVIMKIDADSVTVTNSAGRFVWKP